MSKYTGLILVTGASTPGLEGKILDTLAPFTIQIIDKQSMDIRDRFFLAIFFSLDKAHQKAIIKDLEAQVEALNLDLASDFRQEG